MTVCIAAISKKEDVLAVADKKLTNSGGVTSVYEISENKKIVQMTPNCIALFAGAITEANQILKLAQTTIGPADTIADIANKIQAAYTQRLQDAINKQVLQKFGLDINTFMSQQRMLDPTFVSSTIETLNSANLGVEILITGKDSNGPQIFKMNVMGVLEDTTPLGYACIGSGSSHANLSLIESESHANLDKAALVYAVMKAKKRAEYDPNVGHMSSMVLINDTIHFIEDDVIEKLWKEHDRAAKSISKIADKSSIIMKGYVYGTDN